MKRLILSAALAAALAACGGGGDDGNAIVNRGCDLATQGFCSVLTGPAGLLDQAGFTAASCTEAGGSFVTTCPAAGRIGTCTVVASNGVQTVTIVGHYDPPTYDATSAAADCAGGGGTFVAD